MGFVSTCSAQVPHFFLRALLLCAECVLLNVGAHMLFSMCCLRNVLFAPVGCATAPGAALWLTKRGPRVSCHLFHATLSASALPLLSHSNGSAVLTWSSHAHDRRISRGVMPWSSHAQTTTCLHLYLPAFDCFLTACLAADLAVVPPSRLQCCVGPLPVHVCLRGHGHEPVWQQHARSQRQRCGRVMI